MTTNAVASQPSAVQPPHGPQDLAVLRSNLEQADAGVLVAVLAQLSGDPGVVDRFGSKIAHVPDPRSNSVSPIRRPGRRW